MVKIVSEGQYLASQHYMALSDKNDEYWRVSTIKTNLSEDGKSCLILTYVASFATKEEALEYLVNAESW